MNMRESEARHVATPMATYPSFPGEGICDAPICGGNVRRITLDIKGFRIIRN